MHLYLVFDYIFGCVQMNYFKCKQYEFQLQSCAWGHHVYKSTWSSLLGKLLQCKTWIYIPAPHGESSGNANLEHLHLLKTTMHTHIRIWTMIWYHASQCHFRMIMITSVLLWQKWEIIAPKISLTWGADNSHIIKMWTVLNTPTMAAV